MTIDEVLTRGVQQVLPTKDGLGKLMSKKKIRLYQGFDPTGTLLHIGHAVGFRKLRQFQDLGHEVIFLIGDGTGQAGDPSGKKHAREKFFTREELRQNGLDYVMQASKIVRFDGPNPVKIMYNGDWLNKLNLVDILKIAQNFSVQQLIERDMYQERIKANESINLREFLYPLLQGYDSVAMEVDLEIGGNDQTFNMLAGRTLVKSFLNKEKFVLSVPLLTDSKGVKIGKSEGNVIGLTDNPNEFYAKIMALGDESIVNCFTLLTDKPLGEIEKIKEDVDAGRNAMKHKKQLAYDLTAWLNSKEDAQKAQDNFEKTFRDKKPEYDEEIENKGNLIDTLEVIMGSKSEAKRMIKQGGVDVNGDKADSSTTLKSGDKINLGKRKFFIIK
jgi:tyrosyl-tRNA synthetase